MKTQNLLIITYLINKMAHKMHSINEEDKNKDYKAQRLYIRYHRAKNDNQRLKAQIKINEYFENKRKM